MNTSTQTLSTLLPKTSFKNFTVFALCFIGAFVAYQAENPARMVAAFILLATVSLVAYLAFCLIRFTFKVLAKQPNANVQKTQVKQPVKNAHSNPTFSSDGSLMVNGKAIMTKQELTGQRDNDYIPADTDTYGSDSKTLIQGQLAKDKYEQKTLETADSSGERAYHLLKRSFATQKPDLSNDPMWKNTDQVLDNLTDITKDFANCTLTTELISSGKDYHVPKYETCEKLPVVEETFTISHEYKVGILRHKSGPVNLVSCGNGCTQVWIGTVGNNYWPGWCTIYEESMSVEVLKPDKITYAVLDRSKFDDYHQVYLNGVKIYNGPNGEFPPEVGTKCELSTSWDTRPNINVTSSFTSVPEYGEITFKTRTSVAGEGEGYSSLLVYYNMNDLVYGDNWTTQENIDKAFQVKKQIDDGYCTGSFQCTDMPSLDAAGCTVMNGVKVCESNFKSNPFASLGISPFCRKVEVTSNCGFNEGQFCSKDLNGVERCFDNDTVDRNQCKKYEENPTCSYIKSECVEGAEGSSGHCYVQEDTYDCGFTASTGQPKEEQVLRCNGKLQCVGENCYSPARDGANEDFGKVNAYLEMLKYAKADMTCQGIPESPYDADAPPDQYIPVPSCADGFVYNKQTNQCLKPTGCTYSDNDFYAASSRNGIQVLVGNQVVVDDASVPTCIPVKKNGVTYTCGEAKKKLATDTFYEVCTNAESPVIPSGCPSPDHTLNPKTGYCEIPPTPTCPEGVPLIEGGDPWSVLDDKCLLDIPAVPKCNNANETYDAATGLCNGITYTDAQCDSGLTLSNGQCVGIKEGCYFDKDAFVISNGEHSGLNTPRTETRVLDGLCHNTYYDFCGDDPATIKPSNAYLGSGAFWRGKQREQWKYYSGSSAGCGRTLNYSSWGPSSNIINRGRGTLSNYNGTGHFAGWCIMTQDWNYTYEICTNVNTTKDPVCAIGSYDSATGKCKAGSVSPPEWVCSEEGTYYNATTGRCIREEPASISCPTSYPIWNAEENRCESSSISPLANVRSQFELNNEPLNPTQTQEVIAMVLSPFEHMLDTLIPKANASSELQGSEEAKLTQETMQQYVAEQFLSMAEEQQNNIALTTVGRQQLMGLASASSTAQPMSMSTMSTSSVTTSSGGDTNVTCELFKGTASECKIAVGGMQNCCESPVAVTLADYISLTTKMMQMDALTGQVMGLENYPGVWETASTWGSATAQSAWSAVQGEFISPADIVAQMGTDGANKGLMSAVAQQMMQYTNQFLIDTFGPEVAKMFFQEVGTSAAGEAVLGASAEMAAAGQALMYVYYAYLAYVVFNLLVNVIYECEEEELDLAMKRELLSTHKIGSYCKTEVLGSCIEKRQSYCVFDSPLSRIMMEQIYAQSQMNLNWGTAKKPNCTGVGIQDLDKVDWDEVNLDEWIGILISTGNYTDMVNVNIDSLTGKGSNLNTQQGGTDRNNVLEANRERMENIDADEVRRDAYEDAWSRSQ
ncbi:conjugal transfer protein TraN (plasmid) [Vibrio furnissii]|uniref:conjugal transfer protein TraN n=1 Tax=Vibrio furnissii TaxID=29494 RepID=UPI002572B88B|nr:conjugal transfer protein TraN [Vibrio furnissii]WJG29250.1 conjugal transfer protein TraN [Vibrio furnissii]